MEFIIQDLDNRKRELDEYFELLKFLDNNSSIKGSQGDEFQVTSLLKKTAKGSVYLILYSLVESTMREAVVSIHDEIKSSNSSFDDLREELKCKILSRARRDKISVDKLIVDTGDSISLNLHQATLNSKDLFSGNIDRAEIKKVAKIYGFSHSTDYINTGHGEQLSKVKDNRNDLAHGNKTFSVVGGETSIIELIEFSNKVISYIYEITDNILDSIDGEKYLNV
jgi:hypothetical protein